MMINRSKRKAVEGPRRSTFEQARQVENEDETGIAKFEEVFKWSSHFVISNEEDVGELGSTNHNLDDKGHSNDGC